MIAYYKFRLCLDIYIHYQRLATPGHPAQEGRWVEQALSQNLRLKANEYASQAAKDDIEDNIIGLQMNLPL